MRMTLEAKLDAVIEELKMVNAKLAHIGVAAAAPQGQANVQEVLPAERGDKPADIPAPSNATAAAAPAKAKAQGKKTDTQAPAAPAPVSYDTVKAAVQKAVAGGKRDAVVALLGTYGAKNAQELKPEQYAEALAKLDKLQAL
jgi:hypothetical protein